MQCAAVEAIPEPWPLNPSDWPLSAALLIIDMQRDFCEPGGYIASMGYGVEHVDPLIPRIAAVRHRMERFGAKIIYTREGHRPDLADLTPQKAARSRRGGAEIGAPGPLGRFLVRGEPGWDIIPQLSPGNNDIVIDKPGYSAFHATDLEQILRVHGVRCLVLCGVTTDVCVHSTLRAAIDLGFDCLVLEDCCAATVAEHHTSAIGTIATEGGIFGSVTSSKSLLAATENLQDLDAF
ncbi:cysteine hydrolase [Roseibium aquae]|uniref:Cysteine hydrolase n=1 Tax=Roseibium aquae TaxID=1323746 RepID=A0A916X2H9_9HYPH|nr:isochorismatase family cysteine hydrolase [Roseibium aquae]GGB63683.1 cysteine hydrolase [Roseibium aquae]